MSEQNAHIDAWLEDLQNRINSDPYCYVAVIHEGTTIRDLLSETDYSDFIHNSKKKDVLVCQNWQIEIDVDVKKIKDKYLISVALINKSEVHSNALTHKSNKKDNDKSKIKVSEAKETMGDYPFFTSGKAVLNYHTALVSGRKIFLNTGGNADVKYYIGEASYSTDTWCIEGKSGLTDFLYLALYDYLPEIEQICFEGSALRHLQKAKLKTLPICIPSIDENMPFFCAIKSIFDRQSANIQENKRLAALRDTLLPKLMRGEIDVSNVQI